MTKIEYLLKILPKLIPYWENAVFLIEKIEKKSLTETEIDKAYKIISELVNKEADKNNLEKFDNFSNKIKEIKINEQNELLNKTKELENLDDLINNL